MHQLLATLFSLLVALCHHTSLTARPVEAAEVHAETYRLTESTRSTMILPDRYQLAHGANSDGYAESACPSCRRIFPISIER